MASEAGLRRAAILAVEHGRSVDGPGQNFGVRPRKLSQVVSKSFDFVRHLTAVIFF